MSDNQGHQDLLKDLGEVFDEAKSFEFDDFQNEKYPAPKIALVEKLEQIKKNVAEGKYDQ